MSTKRGSSIENIGVGDDVKMEPRQRPTSENTSAAKQTVFIPRKAHKRLRDICYQRGISQQQVMLSALNTWFIEQGEPSIQEMESGKQ